MKWMSGNNKAVEKTGYFQKKYVMMTEKEKMLAGEFSDTSDPELQRELIQGRERLGKFNRLTTSDKEYRSALRELVPGIPDSSVIMPPFQCEYGDRVTIGKNVYINFNCCFVDGGTIKIGDYSLIGPSVQIYTPQHPMDYLERRKTIEKAPAVVVGDDCWIGGGTVICPGVTIGDRCVIGAGSVVVKDIPADSLAVGNPASVVRKLNGVE